MNQHGSVRARVLVVDDEPALMQALCETLRAEGYEVAGCTGARAALAALHETRFELLLSDLAMPDMDGIALLAAARAVDPDMVAVIMTGAGSIASAVEAMKLGAYDYILKPVGLGFLRAVLARALEKRRLSLHNAALARQLRARAEELEAANRDLEAFAHSVAHDLRAPLRAVSGFSRILLEDYAPDLDAEGRRLVDVIADGAVRMGALVEGLLRLSRVAREPIQRETVSMVAIVRSVADALRADVADGKAELRIDDVPGGSGDPVLIRQIWANLLSNAFKFAGRKEHPVVEVGSCMDDGERAWFVRDNGAGFDMNNATGLFTVFRRLHGSEEFPGSGIGLSIVQRIVRRHGGRLWAEGQPGVGATFYFTLPD